MYMYMYMYIHIPTRGGWTQPRDVRANNIPEHGQWRNVWGKRFFSAVVFSGAPQAVFGEKSDVL